MMDGPGAAEAGRKKQGAAGVKRWQRGRVARRSLKPGKNKKGNKNVSGVE